MGVDIHVYVTKRDKVNNCYHWIKIFDKNGNLIPAYEERNYSLFDALNDNPNNTNFASIPEICFDKDFLKEFKESQDIGFYGWGMINLADLKLYAMNPIHFDSNNEYGDEINKTTFDKFINKIESYAEIGLYNEWGYHTSDIFIFFWFDH